MTRFDNAVVHTVVVAHAGTSCPAAASRIATRLTPDSARLAARRIVVSASRHTQHRRLRPLCFHSLQSAHQPLKLVSRRGQGVRRTGDLLRARALFLAGRGHLLHRRGE